MQHPDIFTRPVCDQLIARIHRITPGTRPQWGTMNAAQMLAHCSKAYDALYDADHQRRWPPAKGLKRFMLKLLVKGTVCGPKPYPRNGRTAPSFVVADHRELEHECTKLVNYLNKVQSAGAASFQGKASASFGPLNVNEWNTLFYKHLHHHLTQFGV
ncbi:MAG: hypothetical protein KBH07_04715 [Flavobacteriales bacterium]|nr:hypothetical protein [Flavobacteriales bacterium]MBP9080830.1 hypothetical protein [Flavobacteriales bacterium]